MKPLPSQFYRTRLEIVNLERDRDYFDYCHRCGDPAVSELGTFAYCAEHLPEAIVLCLDDALDERQDRDHAMPCPANCTDGRDEIGLRCLVCKGSGYVVAVEDVEVREAVGL